MDTDLRWHSAAAVRNRGPIVAELLRLLPAQGLLLEIASGTGQHAAHCAAAMTGWQWQPTDADPGALASVGAWCAGLPNVLPPLALDVLAAAWPGVPAAVDAIFCANLIHIAPWPVCGALMRGAARHLAAQGRLVLYGPYVEAGIATAASNLAFDADLRRRNASWGLRHLDEVLGLARGVGLQLQQRIAMPSNNLLLVLARRD
jgi:SAM-dependent methyltransferase